MPALDGAPAVGDVRLEVCGRGALRMRRDLPLLHEVP